ncbi:E3 ubiquitin-protein ligase RNF186-like [Varanus komodoensis]|uniref:E3 ubiquitin-protein ligase RNF186-like n=1 Tax=Varanus komodoensis TaxID=61221 RepID=UPI001CF7D2CF|nr:E3 ubiquitin-protein ligase RNF186-like [Varanus komodoensis]
MEPSGDGLRTEKEMETGETGRLGAAEENSAQPETSEGPAGQGESVPASSAGESLPAVEGPTEDAADPVPAAPLQPPTPGSTTPSETPPAEPPDQPGLSRASLAEPDCLICFHRYSPQRPPKLLACQHAFCAVCLKQLLRREDRAWRIGCPLCRKATVVFGGLVCSLRDREGPGERLRGPGPGAEGPCPATGAGPPQAAAAGRDGADAGANRAAAKRLLLLLLLVALLTLLLLPFLYAGLLKWALWSVAALGLLLSVVLSCNPGRSCAHQPWPPWRSKAGQGASAA